MVSLPVSQILVGLYLGLLAGIFPAFIAFAIGFGFKYFTSVTVPGLGVVVLGGALAGISGGLMGLVDPQLTGSWTGIVAILVILMFSLWAHNQGDKLGAATPRKLTLKSLRHSRLSADLVERVDSYGQVHIRPIGEIRDIDGYPPLPDDLREKLGTGSWKFPANSPVDELETRLEERLTTDYELAEVDVTITREGRAQIAAAPSSAGLSRRVDPGKRAVSIQTFLPTGVARGDSATLELPDGAVTGPVVSARTAGLDTAESTSPSSDAAEDEAETELPAKAPTTSGGEGQITVALPREEAQRVVRAPSAPVVIHSMGTQPEYEAIGVLKHHGNRFRKVVLGDGSSLVGTTIGSAQIRDSYGVAILAIRRLSERIIAPRGTTELMAGDALILVGKSEQLRAFEEVAR